MMAIAAKSVNQPTIGPATGSVGAKQYNTNDKANRTGNNSQYVIMNFFISWIFTKIIIIVNYDRERMIRYCVRVYLKNNPAHVARLPNLATLSFTIRR